MRLRATPRETRKLVTDSARRAALRAAALSFQTCDQLLTARDDRLARLARECCTDDVDSDAAGERLEAALGRRHLERFLCREPSRRIGAASAEPLLPRETSA